MISNKRHLIAHNVCCQDYDGFKDIDAALILPAHAGHPQTKQIKIPLLPESLELDLCSETCPTYHVRQLGPPLSIFPLRNAPLPAPLPSCSNATIIKGAYVPSNPMDLIYPKYSVPYPVNGSRATTGLYTWVAEGCRFDHAGLRFRDHEGELRSSQPFLADPITCSMHQSEPVYPADR